MLRILVVDDDRSIRRTLELILQREGYSVTTARDAASAIDAAERGETDLIVLDLDLPDGNAFDALAAVAGMSEAPAVVVLTGRDSAASFTTASQLGVSEYLVKPVGLDRMLDAVKRALSRRGSAMS